MCRVLVKYYVLLLGGRSDTGRAGRVQKITTFILRIKSIFNEHPVVAKHIFYLHRPGVTPEIRSSYIDKADFAWSKLYITASCSH